MSAVLKAKTPVRTPALSPVAMLLKLDGYFKAAGYDCDHPWRYELAGTMAAFEDDDTQEVASEKIRDLSNDNELAGLYLGIMLNSVVSSLDDLREAAAELGPTDSLHGSFNAISCFTSCARKMVAEMVDNSLAMAKHAREVAK